MTVLDDILAGVAHDLEQRRASVGIDDLKRRAARQEPALDPMPVFKAEGVSVIAEVKRCSPSGGMLDDIADPADLAEAYATGGAAAISVLTERQRFHGSLDDLARVQHRVNVPVLRKDFLTTAYELWEARAAGADMALLIVAALSQNALISLVERARSMGLTPLVEAHDAEELDRALDAGADVIGINARDLKTLELDTTIFEHLAPRIPDHVVKVAESGIQGPHDVIEYGKCGADVVLVGETLVRGDDPRGTVADLVAAGEHPALHHR